MILGTFGSEGVKYQMTQWINLSECHCDALDLINKLGTYPVFMYPI